MSVCSKKRRKALRARIREFCRPETEKERKDRHQRMSADLMQALVEDERREEEAYWAGRIDEGF